MSRKIDALVAEHVMGLPMGDETGRSLPIKHYSTDIAAAWGVVEKMAENKWGFLLEKAEWSWNENNKSLFIAGFGRIKSPVDSESFKVEKIPAAPMAICLAALKAKGVDIKALEEK